MHISKLCYFCGKPASSEEHVPPKCIFPEKKDLPEGVDYRKNLITVPSCDQHNTKKSRDDEYLLLILVHGYFNNIAGRTHFNKKIIRAITRRPAMLAALYKNQHSVTVDTTPTIAVDIDRIRFNKILEQLCQGLFFKKYAYTWPEEIEIHCPILLSMNDPDSDKVNTLVNNLSKAITKKLDQNDKNGENQDIFWYQMLVDNTKKSMLCRMMFYGGFEILAISNPLLRSRRGIV